jgi:hypothetical protein
MQKFKFEQDEYFVLEDFMACADWEYKKKSKSAESLIVSKEVPKP